MNATLTDPLERIRTGYQLVARAVAVFDAHDEPITEKEARAKSAWVVKEDGGHVRRFDRDALEEMAERCNRNARNGNPALFGPGHRQFSEDIPETEQPEPWGAFLDFRVEDRPIEREDGTVDDVPFLVADQYARPAVAEKVKTYPHRSIELWAREDEKDSDYVALLRRRGKRDLGALLYQRPGGPSMPTDPTSTAPDPDALTPEEEQMAERFAKHYAKKFGWPSGDKPINNDKFGAVASGAVDAGYPTDQAAAMASKAAGEYTGDDDDNGKYRRAGAPTRHERELAARLDKIEKENRLLKYERELMALKDEEGYEINVQDELRDVQDISPEMFGRHVNRIRRIGRQAPVGSRLVPTDDRSVLPDRPDVISTRHMQAALAYQRKRPEADWEEAVEKTRGA